MNSHAVGWQEDTGRHFHDHPASCPVRMELAAHQLGQCDAAHFSASRDAPVRAHIPRLRGMPLMLWRHGRYEVISS
jgi:hypothetical protein